jgi:hypothetical protein
MDAKQLMELLQKQKEETAAIQALWKTLFPKLHPPPDESQCFIWLDGRSFDDVVDGLKAAAKRHNAHRQKIECGEDLQAWDRAAAMKFSSSCMLSLGIDRMSDEEKFEQLSKIRSEAGKRGARSRWQLDKQKARSATNRAKKQQVNGKTENSEFAMACQRLPSSLPLKVKVDGLGLDLGLDSGCGSGFGEPAPTGNEKEEREPKPKPKTKTNGNGKLEDAHGGISQAELSNMKFAESHGGIGKAEWNSLSQAEQVQKCIDCGISSPDVVNAHGPNVSVPKKEAKAKPDWRGVPYGDMELDMGLDDLGDKIAGTGETEATRLVRLSKLFDHDDLT